MAAELPGYYFDETKKRYFKIEASQTAPPDAKWSAHAVKKRKVEAAAQEAEHRRALSLCRHVKRHALQRDPVASGLLARENTVVDDADIAAAAWAESVVSKGHVTFLPGSETFPNMPCLFVGGDDTQSSLGIVYATLDQQTLVSSYIATDDNSRVCSRRNDGPFIRSEMIRCPEISSINYHKASHSVMITSRESDRGCGLYFFSPPLSEDDDGSQPYWLLGESNAYECLSIRRRQQEEWFPHRSTPAPASSNLLCLVGTSAGIIRVNANETLSWVEPPRLAKSRPVPHEVFDQDFKQSDHNVIIAGGRQPRLWIKDLRTSELHWDYVQHASSIAHVRSVNDHQVLVGGLQNSMSLYDMRFFGRESHVASPLVRFPDYTNEAHFHTGWDVDTNLGVVAAAHDDGTVKLFSLRSGRRLRCKALEGIRTPAPIRSLMFQRLPTERTSSLFVGEGPLLKKFSFGTVDADDEG
ncbi:hypothetical protein CDD80_4101 [Ophiocordyceps camponoti-rufipedis]|uniref:Myocyte-specific enhancer factor 2d n=1 Tax=Ophiocordyceps camponoti-rufipedis TaxID=2004952 RepID=A0A2C5YZ20_9HYPO|nr:hypothetical protein CDD80_4101 [Ophiocordyceps camponoti-rufipedis]